MLHQHPDHLKELASQIAHLDREVRISGPNAALLHQTASFAAKGELVPSFAQEWRTRRDSNS